MKTNNINKLNCLYYLSSKQLAIVIYEKIHTLYAHFYVLSCTLLQQTSRNLRDYRSSNYPKSQKPKFFSFYFKK